MHTEHLTNVQPVRVLSGWLVSVAVTGIAVFAFIGLGLMGTDAARDTAWAVTAVAVGFMVGGWVTGFRTLEAPILHGIALGLTSLLAWVILNVLVAIGFGIQQWTGLTPAATLGVLLTQIVAAVVGCRVGTAQARGRAADLTESPATGVRERGGE